MSIWLYFKTDIYYLAKIADLLAMMMPATGTTRGKYSLWQQVRQSTFSIQIKVINGCEIRHISLLNNDTGFLN